ncbi:DUF4382 domain-containing protein [Winogradskyella tangerina]|uniref:DUF4382 domain-containing protein n=1 Tax=Winogradskyella tangerina TaxID=2023240 RepID=UPI000DBE3A62|nr:DUF4382 domain-containing protein [Winogradskyella tangerina]
MKYCQPLLNLLIVVILSTCFINCSKDEINPNENVAHITVKLKSTSQSLDKVYLDIQDVQLNILEVDGSSNWLSLNAINTGVHNATDLNDDNTLLLVDDTKIEANYIEKIRLVLGDDNFININNVLHYLDVSDLGEATPSNLIKIQLISERRYDMVIDLDIDASVSLNENENTMVLNPKLYTAIRLIEY